MHHVGQGDAERMPLVRSLRPRLPVTVAAAAILLATATISLPSRAAATLSATFAVTADATIRSDKPTQNFGTLT
ncbi:MAG TPA: hypothetical protein VIK65_10010, partial [Candidatus Limnocylindrales bacterium]